MSLPTPKSTKEYPFYIVGYLIVSFFLALAISTFSLNGRISKNGLYVEYYPCLEEGQESDDGRPTCEIFGKTPSQGIPVGTWLESQAKVDFIFVSVIIVPAGLYLWYRSAKGDV